MVGITRRDAEAYIGQYVNVTWPQTPEEQAYYGCEDGGMAGIVWQVDDDYLVTDDGMGVKLSAIKSIVVTDEPAAK